MDIVQEDLGTGLPGVANKNSFILLNKHWITFIQSVIKSLKPDFIFFRCVVCLDREYVG